MSKTLLTLPEAALITETSTATLRQAIADGRLKATKRGRDWFIAEREVRRYVDARRPWYPPASQGGPQDA